MIKYNLKCKNKHEFESWFSDSKEFERLRSKNMIECVFCNTKSVTKSIMSPRVMSKEQKEKENRSLKEIQKIRKDLQKMSSFAIFTLSGLLKKISSMWEIDSRVK